MKSLFKKIIKEIVLFALMLFVVSNVISYLRAPKLQSTILPAIDTVMLDGSTFTSKEIRKKPLIIHFWATWCPVCKTEASTIQSISKTYEVLTIAVGSGTDEELRTFMDQNGYNFRVVNDNEGVLAEQFKVEVFPTTFIFDRDGKLKFTEVGYTTLLGFKGRLGVLK